MGPAPHPFDLLAPTPRALPCLLSHPLRRPLHRLRHTAGSNGSFGRMADESEDVQRGLRYVSFAGLTSRQCRTTGRAGPADLPKSHQKSARQTNSKAISWHQRIPALSPKQGMEGPEQGMEGPKQGMPDGSITIAPYVAILAQASISAAIAALRTAASARATDR